MIRFDLIWIAAITFVIAASLFLSPQGPDKMKLPGVGVMPQMSPFVSLTGIPGPTTGLTRSFVNTAHFRFPDAFRSHLLGPLSYVAMLVLYAVLIRKVVVVLRAGPGMFDNESSQPDKPDWLRLSLLPIGMLFATAWAVKLLLGWY